MIHPFIYIRSLSTLLVTFSSTTFPNHGGSMPGWDERPCSPANLIQLACRACSVHKQGRCFSWSAQGGEAKTCRSMDQQAAGRRNYMWKWGAWGERKKKGNEEQEQKQITREVKRRVEKKKERERKVEKLGGHQLKVTTSAGRGGIQCHSLLLFVDKEERARSFNSFSLLFSCSFLSILICFPSFPLSLLFTCF
mmetsp:Transcript_47992/g.94743  ORF Transcript_47992/g.94743 Transcript_47992/m.94743 type:complete len:194 (-) Transcript_47992:199-780(-)